MSIWDLQPKTDVLEFRATVLLPLCITKHEDTAWSAPLIPSQVAHGEHVRKTRWKLPYVIMPCPVKAQSSLQPSR